MQVTGGEIDRREIVEALEAAVIEHACRAG